MAHVVVGKLDPQGPSKPHLLVCRQLQATNNSTIARLVNDAMTLLWPSGIQYEKVILLVSDAAPYMLKAGRNLGVFYPNLLHVTCLAHALHRVAEAVRASSKNVNNLVSSVRKVFVKAPTRVELYKSMNPELKLPPEPVLTRWGTWLTAVSFHADNFKAITSVIERLDEDSAAITKAKETARDPQLGQELAFIKTNFGTIPKAIESLEKRDLPPQEAIQIVQTVQQDLEGSKGAVADAVKEKLSLVLQKNPGFKRMCEITKVLSGEQAKEALDIPPDLLAAYKYAPTTSVEVERTFSVFKHVLSDHRRKLTPENLEKMLVIQCNRR